MRKLVKVDNVCLLHACGWGLQYLNSEVLGYRPSALCSLMTFHLHWSHFACTEISIVLLTVGFNLLKEKIHHLLYSNVLPIRSTQLILQPWKKKERLNTQSQTHCIHKMWPFQCALYEQAFYNYKIQACCQIQATNKGRVYGLIPLFLRRRVSTMTATTMNASSKKVARK